MRNPVRTPFGVIFQNEVLLNSKRIAPYALMIFFSSNAVLWTSAAIHFGWAINSDFYIVRNYSGFTFGILGLPLFAAVIMADPVIRDFRLGKHRAARPAARHDARRRRRSADRDRR